ncbi:glycosyltransferase family 4 protein [Azospirillum sp.]|uniref:glycosyltransferase family 4 protein n=1 Tax=Azospirillum sp. TaxID=34012 RepID=UPI003D74B3EF
MNILVINHYAGSDRLGMEYRPFYLGREWASQGHAVTVIGSSFSHLRTHRPEIRADLDATEEEGIRFRWLRTGRYAGNGLGRVVNMMTFVGKLMAYADHIAGEVRPDLVICSSTYPLDIYPGARIARLSGARLVFEVHDLWPLSPMLLGGYSPRHPYIRLMQMAEDAAYRRADAVVSILPHTLEHMVTRGMNPRKFIHVPNGIPLAHPQASFDGDLPAEVEAVIERERARGRFLIGYAGGLNLSNAVEPLVEAARLLAHEDVSFLLVGSGNHEDALRAQAARHGLDNFHLLGRIPKRAVQTFLTRQDALVVSWARSPLYRYGISPNKIFDYMLAGRPVVQGSDASNDLVGDAECGITVAPDDPAALAQAILALRRMPVAERQRLGANGRRFVLQHHDYQVLAARFLQAVAPTAGLGGRVASAQGR